MYNKSKISNKGLAINEQKLLLSTISTLTILNILNIDNIGYAKIMGQSKKLKEHPNADFKVNPSDGSFTYTYGKSNGNVNNGRNNNDDGQHNISTNHSSGQNNVAHRYSTSQKKLINLKNRIKLILITY